MKYTENTVKLSKNLKETLPKYLLPREKLGLLGIQTLTEVELLALILGSGIQGKNVLDLSQELISHFKGLDGLGDASWLDIKNTIKGMGEAKAKYIAAIFELGKRRNIEVANRKFQQITSEASAIEFAKSHLFELYADEDVEHFYVIFMNRANVVIKHEEISKGGITATVVDLKIILKKALLCSASSLIIMHNHPSGNLTPSKEDLLITQKLKSAAEMMDIRLLDHIIVSYQGVYSFLEHNHL